jgi:hypothetical protein
LFRYTGNSTKGMSIKIRKNIFLTLLCSAEAAYARSPPKNGVSKIIKSEKFISYLLKLR